MNEVVILVGRQGSGKTHYCRTVLPEHVRLSQDEGPRDFERLFRRYQKLLEDGVEKVVIDRTNPTRQRRQLFADAARARGYRVRIVHLDVPGELCRQRIRNRQTHPTLTAETMHEAIARYDSQFEAPCAQECDELVVVREPPAV